MIDCCFIIRPECQAQVNEFGGARYKGFNSRAEAEAFINTLSPGDEKHQTAGMTGATFILKT